MIKIIIFIVCAVIAAGLYLAALRIGFLMGKRKYDVFKGKNPEEMTVEEIWETLNEPQKIVVSYLIGKSKEEK